MARAKRNRGTSLAKGPVSIVGIVLLAYGITALIFGGHSFSVSPLDGSVTGKSWLGLEVNAWSSLLFIGAGALLLFGAPLHWAAKSMSLIVGIGLLAVGLIAYIQSGDALGIFDANGLTRLVWVIAGGVLVILALLPRVGGEKQQTKYKGDRDHDRARRDTRNTRDDADTGARRATTTEAN